jgi:hypothetical protein
MHNNLVSNESFIQEKQNFGSCVLAWFRLGRLPRFRRVNRSSNRIGSTLSQNVANVLSFGVEYFTWKPSNANTIGDAN